jgi:hypothetical protein
VPAYLADVDPWILETAADNRFVTISGDDILPDMHLGRLPVRTAAEANDTITKIIAYEQSPAPEDWNLNVMFVADDADSGGAFDELSDDIADNYLPPPYVPEKIYYSITHPDASNANQAIIDGINQGRLIVSYIGHANRVWWAEELLFEVDDIPSLTNAGKLPFMVPMTCLEGYYIQPDTPEYDNSSLSEALVHQAETGAIASWAPTGYGIATGHDWLEKGLYIALFEDNVSQIGAATSQSKYYMASNTGGYQELYDTYVLLGDPATNLQLHPTHALQLEIGWNLVSFNLQPMESTAPEDVLAPISGKYDLVYAYQADDPQDPWKIYDPSAPGYVNDLVSMSESQGFWIHMTEADTLAIPGNPPTSTDIPLWITTGGWNLVGYPSAGAGTLPDVLRDHGVGDDFSLVYAYHADDVQDPWKLFDPNAPGYVNDLTEMTPGWGYWIYVTADHTWQVDY